MAKKQKLIDSREFRIPQGKCDATVFTDSGHALVQCRASRTYDDARDARTIREADMVVRRELRVAYPGKKVNQNERPKWRYAWQTGENWIEFDYRLDG